jgi:AraC-like DNA-binding protein
MALKIRKCCLFVKQVFLTQNPAVEYLKSENMLINLLTLMTGIVGLITTAIAVFRYKANPLINKYLIVLLSVLSTRFLLRGFSVYFNTIPTEIFTCTNITIVILMAACTHLYFRDLVYSKKWCSKDLIHLIVPSLIVMLYLLNVQQQFKHDKTIRVLYVTLLILCYATYNVLSYRLLRDTIWSKNSKSPFLAKQTATLKSWTVYLYIAIVVLGLMIILVFITNGFVYNSVGNRYQITIASLFWLVFFIKLLSTPELLYGYDFMKIKIEAYRKAEVVLNSVWIMDTALEITNQKDLKIAGIVASNLNNYIHQIESLSFHTNIFRTPALTLEDFAKKLHIPIVHLLYVFKYHCAITFVEYKKMIRIQDAIKMLETGFLKNSTMESLALEVGFSSYKPFFNSFKSITGFSPQEYIRN